MSRKPWIVSARYDVAFFLAPPVLALLAGIAISGTDLTRVALAIGPGDLTASGLFIGVLIHAHLVAVVFRSHANPTVFRRHPVRFLLVPAALWAALMWSEWIAVIATIVATFWDVYHSGAQTFGFARIYDRNAGAPADRDRALDFWMNQLLYAGPILAGATLIDHVEVFGELEGFEDPLSVLLASVPAHAEGHRGVLAWCVIAIGTVMVIVYVIASLRRVRRGEPISPLKIGLVASTGLCSIYTWGLNSWGEAFFVMNLFHAVQYLALVWWSERDHIAGMLRVPGARSIALVVFLGSTLAYGAMAELFEPDLHAWWAVTMVVSLMHFWYDGFVWSVRRDDV
ncbi:hypothetical protein [Sandaracinus amylolyticus]|uniref:hypothetical protein n=1 Tax=Sandaracinus amylolyticus TaxID=927083 RepID=UPI001F318F1B|nr:hypothetical protein [Sandaracinus amylolyticus]UJR86220.1 Hypothetical protein I5071_83020 [Sandaracinus amylolyticus]